MRTSNPVLARYVGAATIALFVTISASTATSMIFNQIAGANAISSPGLKDHPIGARVFKSFCSSCHSLTKGDSKRIGPSLYNIGQVAETRREGLSAAEYLLESIIDPGAYRPPGATGGMPNQIWTRFSAEELRELIAYLASQGGTVIDADIDNLSIPKPVDLANQITRVSLTQLKAGESIFREKANCIACHKLRAHSGYTLIAPSLLDAGAITEAELRSSIENPSDRIAVGYQRVRVELTDGTVEIGILTERSKEGINLLQVNSQKISSLRLSYNDILGGEQARPKPVEISDMPSYKGVLSDEDMQALLAFLRNRHGAIPSHGRTGMFTYK